LSEELSGRRIFRCPGEELSGRRIVQSKNCSAKNCPCEKLSNEELSDEELSGEELSSKELSGNRRSQFSFVLASAIMRVNASIGLILLFVHAFAQTKLSVFNIKLYALAAVCRVSHLTHPLQNDFTLFFNRKKTSASWKIVVIVWFFEHYNLNSLLLFNQAMTAFSVNESQCKME
jgi:hypothetical protein